MAQQQLNRQTSYQQEFKRQPQQNIFTPELRQPARRSLLSPRTVAIYCFAGLCFFCFISSGMGLLLKTSGVVPTSQPTLVSQPNNPSNNSSKLALIVPDSEISNCVPKRINLEQGKVVSVIAVDAIDVMLPDGSIQRVHYIGMTADNSSNSNDQATLANKQLVDGKDVIMVRDVTDKDMLGRLLRYVFIGDTFVNYELVAQGWANLETLSPDVACADNFRKAQQNAASAGLGIWATVANSPSDSPASMP